MSKLDARCQLCAWDRLRALSNQLLEPSLVLGCIFFIKLARATNRARELSWARACALVRDRARLIAWPALKTFLPHPLKNHPQSAPEKSPSIHSLAIGYECAITGYYLRDVIHALLSFTRLATILMKVKTGNLTYLNLRGAWKKQNSTVDQRFFV